MFLRSICCTLLASRAQFYLNLNCNDRLRDPSPAWTVRGKMSSPSLRCSHEAVEGIRWESAESGKVSLSFHGGLNGVEFWRIGNWRGGGASSNYDGYLFFNTIHWAVLIFATHNAQYNSQPLSRARRRWLEAEITIELWNHMTIKSSCKKLHWR